VEEQERLREIMETQIGRIQMLEDLLSNPGWKILTGEMKSQVMLRRQMDFGHRIQGLDDAFGSATNRAEALGIETTMGLPQTLIDEAQIELEAIRVRIQEIERERIASGNDGNDAGGSGSNRTNPVP